MTFAKQFGIEIIPVVQPIDNDDIDLEKLAAGEICFAGLGTAINSQQYDGTPTAEFKQSITQSLSSTGVGSEAVNYKLRDWLFSRQRFWGEPFPILHELDQERYSKGIVELTGKVRTVSEKDLPVELPEFS